MITINALLTRYYPISMTFAPYYGDVELYMDEQLLIAEGKPLKCGKSPDYYEKERKQGKLFKYGMFNSYLKICDSALYPLSEKVKEFEYTYMDQVVGFNKFDTWEEGRVLEHVFTKIVFKHEPRWIDFTAKMGVAVQALNLKYEDQCYFKVTNNEVHMRRIGDENTTPADKKVFKWTKIRFKNVIPRHIFLGLAYEFGGRGDKGEYIFRLAKGPLPKSLAVYEL